MIVESSKMPSAGNSQVQSSGPSVIPGPLTNGPPVPPFNSMTGVHHDPYGARPPVPGGPSLPPKFMSHKDGSQYQVTSSSESTETLSGMPGVPNSLNTNVGSEFGRPPPRYPYSVPHTVGPPLTNGPNQFPGNALQHTATNGVVSGTSTHRSNFPVGTPFIRQAPPVSNVPHLTHPPATFTPYDSTGFPTGPRAPNRNLTGKSINRFMIQSFSYY